MGEDLGLVASTTRRNPLGHLLSRVRSFGFKVGQVFLAKEWPNWAVGLSLSILLLSIAVFRAAVLLASPFPPSGDVAGDIYNAHAWLGHPIPAIASQPLPPPIYYFVVVIPFTSVFNVFLGAELYMSVVPALIVLPGYLLIRESRTRPITSLFGAALLGLSTAFSLMVTWNAAYNLFAIVLLLFFLAFLSRALRKGRRSDILLAGVTLALVGGSHELTFVVGIMSFLSIVILRLILVQNRWASAKTAVAIAGVAAVAFLPFTYIYFVNASQTVNVGTLDYWAITINSLAVAPYFGWGFQTPYNFFVPYLDIAVTLVAGANLFRKREGIPFATIVLGVLAGALAVLLIDAGNAVRGLYFLPIPFMIGIPRLLEDVAASEKWNKPWSTTETSSVTSLAQARRGLVATRRKESPISVALVCGFAVSLLLVNASTSYVVLNQGSEFYKTLTPGDLPILNWVRDNTPTQAVILDTTGLSPWIIAYSDRMSYSPGSLNLEVTTGSYDAALASDLVNSGTYITADSSFLVGTNFPGQVGLPTVFLQIGGLWVELMTTQGNQIHLTVSTQSGDQSFNLGSGELETASSELIPGGVRSDFWLLFPGAKVWIDQSVIVQNNRASISWSSNNSQFVNVSGAFGMPPSGYGLTYLSIPTVANATSVTDVLSNDLSQPDLTISSQMISQNTAPNGWVNVQFISPVGIDLTIANVGQTQYQAPYAVDASDLLHSLDVTYLICNPNDDYGLYLRAQSGQIATSSVSAVFSANGSTVYSVSYSGPDQGFVVGLPPYK